MARPKKQTVDYFPHDCTHKKTIFILEGKFGVNGYAFWFKLLELLGSSDGHYYDCNSFQNWQFLIAKTLAISDDTATQILNLLAELDAIDQDLWRNNKIIWSQNFVDRLEDAYTRRKIGVPKKPNTKHYKTLQNEQLANDEKDKCIQNDSINPQIKLNEIKLNEIKLNESKLNINAQSKSEIESSVNTLQDIPVPHDSNIINKKYSDQFENLFKKYPRKMGKAKAYESVKRILKTKEATLEQLNQAIKNFSDYVTDNQLEEKFIPYASTFFGPGKRWKDFMDPYVKTSSEKKERETRYVETFIDDYGGVHSL